jgi:hypothetical protein
MLYLKVAGARGKGIDARKPYLQKNRWYWCTGFCARDGAALFRRHSKDALNPLVTGLATALVDGSIHSECAKRRASVSTPLPRAMGWRPLFCGRLSKVCTGTNSVKICTPNEKRFSDCLLIQHCTHPTGAQITVPAPESSALATFTRLRRRRSLAGGHCVFRCVLRWGRFFGG